MFWFKVRFEEIEGFKNVFSLEKLSAGYVFILLNTCYKFSPCDQEMLKYTTFSSDCIPQNFNYYALKIKYCKNR